MANGDSFVEAARERIRLKLNGEKVKLWLPPFTLADGMLRGSDPQGLVTSYAEALSLPVELVAKILEELRLHACSKIIERRQNSVSGTVTLRLKLVGNSANRTDKMSNIPVDISLTVRGQDLKCVISDKCSIPTNLLKLIVSGHVLKDDITLDLQNVKDGSQVMVLCLPPSDAAAIAQDDVQSSLARTRQAAEWLTLDENDDNGRYNLDITDQSGKRLDMPAGERKALTLAMMLHERGRAALKKKNYGVALVYFLDADSHFIMCDSSLLNAVDNYAVLSLDIVWCYMCLRNVESLPDAVNRLKAAEEGFRRSYGTNVERLQIVKGGAGKEKALFMRLHLLQGILAYHQQSKEEAKRLLKRAYDELVLLKVDDDAMNQVMAMGYSSLEARLALRCNVGDVHGAVATILMERERLQEQRKSEKEERKKNQAQNKLGRTANGHKVNMQLYESLLGMGFTKGAASASLRQSNNDIVAAVEILQTHPELLSLPDPDSVTSPVSEDIIAQLVSMGFDPVSASAALQFFGANVEKAMDALIGAGGMATHEWLDALHRANSHAQSSSSSTSSTSDATEANGMTQEERDRIIHEEIAPDIPMHDEDYLDLALDEEEELLNEYQARLMSLE